MWYYEYGKDGDVVLSSRVRLARNIAGLPFPAAADKKTQEEIIEKAVGALIGRDDGDRAEKIKEMKLTFIDMANMNTEERQAISECHLISPQFTESNLRRGLVLSSDSRVSVMVNEEDHLRIQCMEAGFAIDKCYATADLIDNFAEEKLDFAFDEDFGYLTCCPTNVGTGLRASVMVHLPGYVLTGKFGELSTTLSQLGLTVRGIYGEGSKGLGNIFQISNQLTLGMTEQDIIDRLKQIVSEVVENERRLRDLIYKNDKYRIEDRVMRSLGILQRAVLMTTDEAMKRLSDLRLGVSLGIIDNVKPETINEITYSILPANIVKNHNTANDFSRDLKRGEIIKSYLV